MAWRSGASFRWSPGGLLARNFFCPGSLFLTATAPEKSPAAPPTSPQGLWSNPNAARNSHAQLSLSPHTVLQRLRTPGLHTTSHDRWDASLLKVGASQDAMCVVQSGRERTSCVAPTQRPFSQFIGTWIAAEITFGGGHASHHVTEVNHQRPPVQYRSSPSHYRPSSAVKPLQTGAMLH